MSKNKNNKKKRKNKTKKQHAENAYESFPCSLSSSSSSLPLPDKMSSPFVLPSPNPTSPNPMSSYVARLASYKNWPIQNAVSSISLAQSGFYYTGTDDSVKCFSCTSGLKRWQAGDVADVVHGKFSPTCEFLSQKLAEANRSSTGSNDAVVKNKTKKQNAENAHEPFPRSSTSSLPDKMSSPSVLPSPPPTSPPPMSSYVARLASYKNWPIQNVVSSISLARSGFYYTGTDDHVKCFSCTGGLKGWEEGDVADVEHGKFYRTCEFLSQKRKEANRSSTMPS
ncbi:baculoviral IAP repeat-containing protein 7-B-like [Antedon mediterranea]|uniref:baculoviral IAP repeat-containing protein 7-B-like n=1 Tax=Antedon mediterranea TaxID=105859 RepID=UPI003AF70202